MSFSHIYLTISTLLVFIIFQNCAVQSPPTGGPIDETPPVLINSIPENKQTNYTNPYVELSFNEWIQVKDLKNQLLITPTYRGEYEVDTKKTIVTIEFDTIFDENTTYTLNFREGIVDITEGNAPEELRIAFSTGDKLDSLSIIGNVIDHLKQEPVDKYVVSLFDVNDSLFVTEAIPKYFTKTNARGFFRFENLKNGEYYIYVYNDVNNDLNLQTATEAHGYLDNTVKLDTNVYDLEIKTIKQNLDTVEISSSRQNGQYFEIKFSKYIDSLNIKNISNIPDDSINYHFFDNNKGLRFYYSFPKEDTLKIDLTAIDSVELSVRDTIDIFYSESRKDIDDFKSTLTENYLFDDSTTFRSKFQLNKPLKSFNKDSIKLFINDTILIEIPKDSINISYKKPLRQVEIVSTLPDTLFYKKDTISNTFIKTAENRIRPNLNFTLKKGSFISIDSDSLKEFSIKSNYRNIKEYGIIKGNISSSTNTIVQLLNQNYEVIRTLENPTEYLMQLLSPGNYFLRALIDENNDGKWDAGNLYLNTQPEPVVYYIGSDGSRTIILKPNWEQIDIDIVYPPVDNPE